MRSNIAYRTIELEARSQSDESVSAVLSTENPVEREGYVEILEHTAEAVDLSRAPLPLIESHDASSTPVGVVRNLRIEGRKLRGDVQFSKGTRGRELLQDVLDGVLRSLSIAYRIKKWREEGDRFIATRWQPFEASVVACPADPDSGFLRTETRQHMNQDDNEEPTVTVGKMIKLYAQFVGDDAGALSERAVAMEGLKRGDGVEWLRQRILEKVQKRPLPSAEIGLDDVQKREYSIVRGIRYLLDPNSKRAANDAGFELEVHRSMEKQFGETGRAGLRIPHEVFFAQKRDLTTSIATSTSKYGYSVATNLLAGDFVDVLRAATVIGELGATFLRGLVGNVAIPRQNLATQVYWVAEGNAPTEGAPTLNQVTMTPKTVGGYVDYTRKLMLQSTPDVENLVRNDLMRGIMVEIDRVGLNGSGSGAEPTGVRQTSGVGSVAIGTNGGAPTWAMVQGLIEAVEIDNALLGRLGFVTNGQVRKKLATTARQASGVEGNFILDASSQDRLSGYPIRFTQNVPSDLTKGSGTNLSAIIYGNWADLLVGLWSGIDVNVDTATLSSSGGVRVVAFQDLDVAVRHAESFSVDSDLVTT